MKIKLLQDYSVDSYLQALLSAVTLFYVLYFFKAYQIETCDSDSGHSFLQRCIGFALLNGFVIYTSNRIFSYLLTKRHKKWNYLKYGVQLLLGSLSIFLLFNFFWNWTELAWYNYQLMFVEYSLVMLIPFGIINFISRKAKIDSFENNDEVFLAPKQIKFASTNGKDFLSVGAKDFLFAKASGNYIELYYLEAANIQKKLLRSSMKTAEAFTEDFPLCKRIHRGYLVNMANVDQVSGTKGKMTLRIHHFSIPVSSSYENELF